MGMRNVETGNVKMKEAEEKRAENNSTQIKIRKKTQGIFQKAKKGSLTIETACLMPLLLLVLMGILYLSFFVHNRAWLTAAAYESALSGSMEGIRKDGQVYETARIRSEELANTGFFGAENLSTQTNVGKEVQVTYDLDTVSGYGGLSWHLRTEGTAKIIDPVKHIRKIRSVAVILKGAGE